MTTPILLTGATGNTGRVIAEQLAERGFPLVGMARSEVRRRQLAALGIDSVHGDFDEPRTLARALTGIEKAYLVCTPDGELIRRETAFIEAAKRAGVRHVVKLSAFKANPDGPSQNLRSHGNIERVLLASGLDATILRPHAFMQTFTMFSWNLIQRAGALALPAGDGGIPLVDVRNVAAVAVLALTEPGHEGHTYDITGPEALTMGQQAEILQRVLGRPVTYLPGSERGLMMMMRLLGVPAVATEHVVAVLRMQREHHMEEVVPTLRSLGITPTTYEQFVCDFIAGRTGGGHSFQPPNTSMVRLLDLLVPALVRTYLRVRGRRPAPRARG